MVKKSFQMNCALEPQRFLPYPNKNVFYDVFGPVSDKLLRIKTERRIMVVKGMIKNGDISYLNAQSLAIIVIESTGFPG